MAHWFQELAGPYDAAHELDCHTRAVNMSRDEARDEMRERALDSEMPLLAEAIDQALPHVPKEIVAHVLANPMSSIEYGHRFRVRRMRDGNFYVIKELGDAIEA